MTPAHADAIRIEAAVHAWLIARIARLHQRPCSPELVARAFPPPHDLAALAKAVEAIGCTASTADLRHCRDLSLLSAPFVAIRRTDHKPGHGVDGSLASAILVTHADRELATAVAPGVPEPFTIERASLLAEYEPHILCTASGDPPLHAGEGPAAGPDPLGASRFGWRWFLPEVLRHRRIWRDIVLASVAIHLMGLAVPLLTQVVIDRVIAHGSWSTLHVVVAGMAILITFTGALGWLRQSLALHTGHRIDAVLAARVFGHLLRLPATFFTDRPTGALVARLNAAATVREFLTGAALAVVLDAPAILILGAVMFAMQWQLALIALAAVGTLALLSLASTPFLRQRLDHEFHLAARNQAFTTEHVAAIETVKALQLEPVLTRRHEGQLAALLGAALRTRQLVNTSQSLAQVCEQAQGLAILAVGAALVMRHDGFTLGMLIAFQMFASRLAQPAMRLAALWPQFQETTVALRRLADILDHPAEHDAVGDRITAGRAGPASIVIEALGFRHGADRPWLYRGVTTTIVPGGTTVLAGPSGSGKSTFARLLLGFVPPTEGRILVNGIDTRHLATNELRAHFAVVPQETMLFSGTVFENVAIADPLGAPADVVRACQAAGVHDVIEALPQGYGTRVGERGVGLSGGQRQRIAIARALLRRSPVLIFDEATSGLDPAAATSIARTVNALRGKVTVVFIAHQLPPGLTVDRTLRFGQPLLREVERARA